jgi:hypothetical protein
MKTSPTGSACSGAVRRDGFSLIEVVLAIGIFLVTVLALVGLLGPTLQSVDEVEKTDEIASVVNTVNAFLQNSPSIATSTDSKFNTIFNAVANDGFATIFVFRSYKDSTSNDIVLRVGFYGETVGDSEAAIVEADFATGGVVLSAGPIYRVVLSPSSVTPDDLLVGDPPVRNADEVYVLADPVVDNYPEGYFAMELRIYAEDAGPAFVPNLTNGLTDLVAREPIFTYNTAIVR